MFIEEIIKRLDNDEKLQFKKINKEDCIADPGKFRMVLVKNETEYFHIERDVEEDDILLLATWTCCLGEEFDGENIKMVIFDDKGEELSE